MFPHSLTFSVIRTFISRLHHVAAIIGVVVYEGAGHAFHWEDPVQFTHDLVAFGNTPEMLMRLNNELMAKAF